MSRVPCLHSVRLLEIQASRPHEELAAEIIDLPFLGIDRTQSIRGQRTRCREVKKELSSVDGARGDSGQRLPRRCVRGDREIRFNRWIGGHEPVRGEEGRHSYTMTGAFE